MKSGLRKPWAASSRKVDNGTPHRQAAFGPRAAPSPSSPPGIAVRRTSSLRSPMTRWSMLKCRYSRHAATLSEQNCRMDCRVKPGNDDMESRSRDAIAPELCHAIPKNGPQSIKPEKSARFGSDHFAGFMRKKIKGKRNAGRRVVHEPRHANECHHSPALRARRGPFGGRSSVGVPPRRLRQRPNAAAQLQLRTSCDGTR
jgi:hypothetical protein